jgi:DNA-binding IclR family transcriptional regulator
VPNSRETGRARGIDRAIELLECLHEAGQPLRIGDIARRLKAPRSTVYELVNRFLQAAILETYDADGRVFFGRALHFYAADYLGIHGLSRLGRAEVIRVAERTGETAQFCMLHGNKYAVVHMQTGKKLFQISTAIGVAVPVPWTASGRLLLDHMTPAEIQDFVPPEDFVLPSGRRIDPAIFYEELCRARRDGYCRTSGLVDDFADCIAVPVRNADDVALACICVVTMGRRNDNEIGHFVEILQDSAGRLSSYLRDSGHHRRGFDPTLGVAKAV